MNKHAIAYRPEIDGLRAICVLGVILFHANLGVSGGFVGVDVFFVISGSLISKIVLEEIRTNRFSLIGFWERRIRRIFPAVLFMQATVLAMGFLLYFPVDYYNLMVASRYLILGVPNLYYWSALDYFSDSGTMFPLLHTWSLGVEEQFYVVFPILISLVIRKWPRQLLPVLVAVTTASFFLSVHQVNSGQSETAFFLLPARAWELLAGCLLTVSNPVEQLSARNREILSTLGLGGIFLAMVTYDEGMSFPGFTALLPVISATVFIAANAPELTRCGRILAHPSFVTIGKLSFSLYLWHWPLISFANLYFPDQKWLAPVIALLSVPLAHFAWYRIEEPFRRKRIFVTRQALFRFFVVANLALFAFVQLGKRTNGFHNRVYALPASARELYRFSLDDFTFSPAGICTQADLLAGKTEILGRSENGGPVFFLWGDSHAMAVSRTIDDVARQLGISGLYAYSLGLDIVPPGNPARYPYPKRKPNDPATNTRILEKIEACGIRNIVIISRWSQHLDYPDGPADLANFLTSIRRQCPAMTVYVVQEVPEQRYVRRTFYYQSYLSEAFGWPFVFLPTDKQDYRKLSEPFDAAFARLNDPKVIRVDVAPGFFDRNDRLAYREGKRSYYIDEDHLSRLGSDKLMKPVVEKLLASIQGNAKQDRPEYAPDISSVVRNPGSGAKNPNRNEPIIVPASGSLNRSLPMRAN
jgi:peptidoglycan/LPS O-acetylase OafA/YrhL